MELYLDTSDVVAVTALSRIFPLAGVCQNQKEKQQWYDCLEKAYRDIAVRWCTEEGLAYSG